jgi:hypothetical protein
MRRIVVAAKAGGDQPWLADAAADLAQEIGAEIAVISLDGLELEALSTLPRDELRKDAERAAQAVAERIRSHGSHCTPRPAPARSCAASSSSPRSRRPT